MTHLEIFKLFNAIFSHYGKEMWIHSGDCGPDNRAYSYISLKEVILPCETFRHPTEWDIMALLHEIGHIKTNKEKMRVFEKEFLAVQWSADEAKRWDFKIKSEWKTIYQDYIWEKRDICIRKKGKNVPDRDALIIHW